MKNRQDIAKKVLEARLLLLKVHNHSLNLSKTEEQKLIKAIRACEDLLDSLPMVSL